MSGEILRGWLSLVSNLSDIAVLATFLATMMTVAAVSGLVVLVTFNTICVIAGVLLDRAALGIVGMNFSTGAMFVAIAMVGLALLQRMYGRQEAIRGLNNIVFALTMVFGTLFLLDGSNLLSPLFDESIRKAGIRLLCIYLMQSLMVHLLDKPSSVPTLIRIPAVVMLCEILEGIILYPCILIGERLPASVTVYTISSIGIRLTTTMLAVPFLILFLVFERMGVAKCAQTK